MNRIGGLFQAYRQLPLLSRFTICSGIGTGIFLCNEFRPTGIKFEPMDAESVKKAQTLQSRLGMTKQIVWLNHDDLEYVITRTLHAPWGTAAISFPKQGLVSKEFQMAREICLLKNWDTLKHQIFCGLSLSLAAAVKTHKARIAITIATYAGSVFLNRRSGRNAEIAAAKVVSSSVEISTPINLLEMSRLEQLRFYDAAKSNGFDPLLTLAIYLTFSPEGEACFFRTWDQPLSNIPLESERINYLKEIYYARGEFPQVQITLAGESLAIEPNTSEAIANIIKKSPQEALLLGADTISFDGGKVVIATRFTSQEYEVDSSTIDKLKTAARADALLLEILTNLLLSIGEL